MGAVSLNRGETLPKRGMCVYRGCCWEPRGPGRATAGGAIVGIVRCVAAILDYCGQAPREFTSDLKQMVEAVPNW